MVALLTSVRNSPCFGGLRRTKTCHRQLFARPSVFLRYFLHAAKSNKNRSLFGNFRGFTNLESTQPNNNFPLTKLKPSQKVDSRFCKPRISSPQWRLRTNKIKSFENFYILFVRHKKYDKKSLPAGSFEVFQTSILLAAMTASHEQN